jgi:hypothetical protein
MLAHVRRKFYDVHQAIRWPMAEDVLKRIGRLYDVEDEARGLPADRRRLIRQEKATPLIDELAAVLDAMLPKLPEKRISPPHPLRPQPLDGAPPLPRRRTAGDRQQRRRTADPAAGDEAFIVPPFFKYMETLEVDFRD